MATLRAFPFDPVRFECRACGRTVQFDKNSLIDRYGDLSLPEIRLAVARDSGCESAAGKAAEAPPCGIVYCDLVDSGPASSRCCGMVGLFGQVR